MNYGQVRCRLCNGRGGSHVPRLPSYPDYKKSWPWDPCDRCGGSGVDEMKTKLLRQGKL